MKITEITEGWGQHSNKSNHTMNKFKREETDENWASSAKAAATKGVKAVAGAGGTVGRAATGAAWRQTKDMAKGVAGKMGFAGQAEKQKMQRIAGGVAKNFARYRAQQDLAQDTKAVQQFLNALGFQTADIKMSGGGKSWAESKVDEVAKGARRGQARGGFDPSKRGAQQPKAQAPAQQAPADDGNAKPVNRNELIKTIADTIQSAIKNNRVPKAIEKFTKI